MSGYIYLASPYTHHDPLERNDRFKVACWAAGKLMRMGLSVFSPIAHSHPIEVESGEVKGGVFWKKQDVPLLRHADALYVLMLDGWNESSGIAWEVEMADQLNIPVTFVDIVDGALWEAPQTVRERMKHGEAK